MHKDIHKDTAKERNSSKHQYPASLHPSKHKNSSNPQYSILTILTIIVLALFVIFLMLNVFGQNIFAYLKYSGQEPTINFCEDSDKDILQDYYAKGTCADSLGEHTDYCEGKIAVEYFCSGAEEDNDLHCEVGGYACPSGCDEGVCLKECTEKWECTPWSGCVNGYMGRACKEISSCGTQKNKPVEKRTCKVECADSDGTGFYENDIMAAGACTDETGEYKDKCEKDKTDYITDYYCSESKDSRQYCVPGGYFCPEGTVCQDGRCTDRPECKESWACDEWSLCMNDTQARNCYDKNKCGTGKGMPETERSCDTSCLDSDGTSFTDNDLKTKGICKDSFGGHEDFCNTENYISDWYCETGSNAEAFCVPGGYFCPKGTACLDGRCMIPQPCKEEWTCAEWGLCGNNGQRKRTCTNSNNCSTTAYRPDITAPCGKDIKCSEDDSGDDYLNRGLTQIYDYKNEQVIKQNQDACSHDAQTLTEYYCSDKDTIEIKMYKCLKGCNNGKCVE